MAKGIFRNYGILDSLGWMLNAGLLVYFGLSIC